MKNIYRCNSVYVRKNQWFSFFDIVKMGISELVKHRGSTYITSEIYRGEFILIVEILSGNINLIDKMLKNYFDQENFYRGSGTEFFNKSIVSLIIPFLEKLNIQYRVLNEEEIYFINKCNQLDNLPHIKKIKEIFNSLSAEKIIKKLKDKKIIKSVQVDIQLQTVPEAAYATDIQPNKQQQDVLNTIEDFFNVNSIGKIVWACGLGKAFLAVLIVRQMNLKSILFGVSSINLVRQIELEILKIFPNKKNILIISSSNRKLRNLESYKEQISLFLNDYNTSSTHEREAKFIITTYHSCYILLNKEIYFDIKIGDECHHLAGILDKDKTQGFRLFHSIRSNKSLFMTATEKIFQTYGGGEAAVCKFSMDDETIFGKYIDIKTVLWAIENRKITDYNILVLKNTEDEVDNIINSLKMNCESFNKEIFISCFMALKSFEKYIDLNHILLYTNTTHDAQISKDYINQILSLNILSITKGDIYNNALHSKNISNNRILIKEISLFKSAKYGIISCVYLLGEGFDLPRLNGVCIAANMQSETRIVQYLLRPNRLEFENPNKKAYIIIPYIDGEGDRWDVKNNSFDKVRNIIFCMRNVDKHIEQKIILNLGVVSNPDELPEDGDNNISSVVAARDYHFEDKEDELERIKMRLRYSKSLLSGYSEEQEEYNYIREINKSLCITSKKEYNDSESRNCVYKNDTDNYFIQKGVWVSWYHFMGLDTSGFIQSIDEWRIYCRENKIDSLIRYKEESDINPLLPKEPEDFYNEFTNILSELNLNIYKRR